MQTDVRVCDAGRGCGAVIVGRAHHHSNPGVRGMPQGKRAARRRIRARNKVCDETHVFEDVANCKCHT